MKLEYSRQIFQKFSKYQIACRPVGVELLNADGQTDRHTAMAKLIVAFRNCVQYVTKTDSTSQCSSRDEDKTWGSFHKIFKGSWIHRDRVCKGTMIRYHHTWCQWKRTNFLATLPALFLSLSFSLCIHTHSRNRIGFSALHWMWQRSTDFFC
jgi:hypothetical protein